MNLTIGLVAQATYNMLTKEYLKKHWDDADRVHKEGDEELLKILRMRLGEEGVCWEELFSRDMYAPCIMAWGKPCEGMFFVRYTQPEIGRERKAIVSCQLEHGQAAAAAWNDYVNSIKSSEA
jgi:hypothetical protein